MKEHKIVITPDGNVRTLYTDLIDLREIGTLKVARASNVEWDEEGNPPGWTVQFADGSWLCAKDKDSEQCALTVVEADAREYGICVFPTRDKALDAEVDFLEARL